MALIQLDHVSKFYSQGKTAAKGLDDVSLSFDKGEFVAITGESGSGKTTLLNVITLMDNYDEGDILFEGKSTADFSEDDLLSFRRDYVSFVFQEYNLIPNLSARENLVIGLVNKGYDRKEARKKAEEALKECGLEKRMHEKVVRLSGGERQRVVIARALALDSPIIAFDEPTGNLDSKTGKEIIDLIDRIKENRLILYVTHDYASIERLCNRHIVLENGRLSSDVQLGERNITKETEKVERGKKNSLSSLLLSCFSLIFSAPKKLALMCLSVFLLTCSTIGIVLAGTFAVNNFNNGMTTLYNRYHPVAFSDRSTNMLYVFGDDETPIPEAAPEGSVAYHSVSYLPFVNLFVGIGRRNVDEIDYWSDYNSYYRVSKTIELPDEANLSYGEKGGDEGFYVLFSEDLSSDTRTENMDFLKDYVGRPSRFETQSFPIMSLASVLNSGNDMSEGERRLANYIESLPLLGVGFGDTGRNSVSVCFPLATAEKISQEVEACFKSLLLDPPSSLDYQTNFYLPVPLDSTRCLSVSYHDTPFIMEHYLMGLGERTKDDMMEPFIFFSDSWAGKENEILVTFNGTEHTLFDLLSLFDDLIDMDKAFSRPASEEEGRAPGSVYATSIGDYIADFPASANLPLFALLLVRTKSMATVYYPSSASCEQGLKTLQDDGYRAYSSNHRYWVGEEPTSLDYIQYCFSAIFIVFIVLVILFVFFFVTYPIIKAILKRYNADFAVLATLGYPRKSLFLFRSVIILLPMMLTYIVVSAIVVTFLHFAAPGFVLPYLFVVGFFLLLLFGALLLIRFYHAESKRTLNSILKDSGGQR